MKSGKPCRRRRPDPGSHFRDHNLADLHRWINQYYQRESQTFAYRTASLAEEWLEENYLQDPFFLWVDFFDPHEPWDPPEYLVRKYDDSGYDGPPLIHPELRPGGCLHGCGTVQPARPLLGRGLRGRPQRGTHPAKESTTSTSSTSPS